jgi:hypothetical protein
MKIRIGFVSNSSTSSFCIFGCCIDMGDACSNLIMTGSILENETCSSRGVIEDIAAQNGIEFYQIEDNSDIYLGFDFTSIPDNVNVGEWKKEKEGILKKFFGENINYSVYLRGWANY